MTTASARRRSRELVLQGLYQRQLSGNGAEHVRADLVASPGFARADQAYFDELWRASRPTTTLSSRRSRRISTRKAADLSPIERAILVIAAWELQGAPRHSVPGRDQRGRRAREVVRRHRRPSLRQRRARQGRRRRARGGDRRAFPLIASHAASSLRVLLAARVLGGHGARATRRWSSTAATTRTHASSPRRHSSARRASRRPSRARPPASTTRRSAPSATIRRPTSGTAARSIRCCRRRRKACFAQYRSPNVGELAPWARAATETHRLQGRRDLSNRHRIRQQPRASREEEPRRAALLVGPHGSEVSRRTSSSPIRSRAAPATRSSRRSSRCTARTARSTYLRKLGPNVVRYTQSGTAQGPSVARGEVGARRHVRARVRHPAACGIHRRHRDSLRRHRRCAGRHGDRRRRAASGGSARLLRLGAHARRAGARQPHEEPHHPGQRVGRRYGRKPRGLRRRRPSTSIPLKFGQPAERKRLLARWQREIGDRCVNEFALIERYFQRPVHDASVRIGHRRRRSGRGAHARVRARDLGGHAGRRAAFPRGRRSGGARPQDARGESVRPRGDGCAAALGAARRRAAGRRRALARRVCPRPVRARRSLRRLAHRRRHHARAAQPVRHDRRRSSGGNGDHASGRTRR